MAVATGVESRAEAKAAEGRVEATAAEATLAATEAETKAELATAADDGGDEEGGGDGGAPPLQCKLPSLGGNRRCLLADPRVDHLNAARLAPSVAASCATPRRPDSGVGAPPPQADPRGARRCCLRATAW